MDKAVQSRGTTSVLNPSKTADEAHRRQRFQRRQRRTRQLQHKYDYRGLLGAVVVGLVMAVVSVLVWIALPGAISLIGNSFQYTFMR